MHRLIIAALLLSACDTQAPSPEASQSQRYVAGNRLHTRVLVGADGSEKFIGFWDDRAGIPCDAAVASDGETRCLPSSSVLATRANLYSDSSCNQELAEWQGTGQPVGVEPANPGGRYSQAGALWTGRVYSDAFGCASIPQPASSLYEIGARIPPSSFVAFAEEIRP